jgi:hypothetical protein
LNVFRGAPTGDELENVRDGDVPVGIVTGLKTALLGEIVRESWIAGNDDTG